MILAKRVLTPEEIASLHYKTYTFENYNFVGLELSVTDDDALFEDVDMRFDHC